MACVARELRALPAAARALNCNMPAFNACVNEVRRGGAGGSAGAAASAAAASSASGGGPRMTVLSTVPAADAVHATVMNRVWHACGDAARAIVHDKCGAEWWEAGAAWRRWGALAAAGGALLLAAAAARNRCRRHA